jgi:hypothetical protein
MDCLSDRRWLSTICAQFRPRCILFIKTWKVQKDIFPRDLVQMTVSSDDSDSLHDFVVGVYRTEATTVFLNSRNANVSAERHGIFYRIANIYPSTQSCLSLHIYTNPKNPNSETQGTALNALLLLVSWNEDLEYGFPPGCPRTKNWIHQRIQIGPIVR